jgi:hypothetical protein
MCFQQMVNYFPFSRSNLRIGTVLNNTVIKLEEKK